MALLPFENRASKDVLIYFEVHLVWSFTLAMAATARHESGWQQLLVGIQVFWAISASFPQSSGGNWIRCAAARMRTSAPTGCQDHKQQVCWWNHRANFLSGSDPASAWRHFPGESVDGSSLSSPLFQTACHTGENKYILQNKIWCLF